MKPKPFFHWIAAVYLPLFCVAFAESELDRIKRTISNSTGILEEPLQARAEKYIDDLTTLEKQISSQGDLDTVLQVKTEREAWKSGNPTKPIDPKDTSFPLELRKLRYYFDQDIEQLKNDRLNAKIARWNGLIDEFDNLEKRLTSVGRIDEALEVRKTRKDFVEGKLGMTSPGSESLAKNTVVVEESKKPVKFSRWLEKVRFIVPSGHAFRIEDDSVFLTPPGSDEKILTTVEIDEDKQTVFWVLSNGKERTITVSKNRKEAVLSADRVEEMEIEEID